MKAKHSALLKTVQHIYKLLSEAGGKVWDAVVIQLLLGIFCSLKCDSIACLSVNIQQKITLPDKLHKRLVAKVTVSSDDTSLAGTSAGGP